MLKILRTKTRKVLLVTLILIIPAFVLFGGWSYIQDRKTMEGKAPVRIADPGKPVLGIKGWKKWEGLGKTDLLGAQRQLDNFLSFILGGQFASGLIGEFGDSLYTNRDRINQAIDAKILLDYAQEHHLTVSENEVTQRVALMLQQVPSEYRQMALQQIMRRGNFDSEAAFLDALRREILIDKASQDFLQQAKVSLFEAWQEYLKREQKLKMDYEPRVAINAGALEQYYGANQEKFRVGEQRQYRYAYYPKALLPTIAEPSEKELSEYFEKNKDKYAKGPQVRVRHIWLPISPSLDLKPEELAAREKEANAKAELAKQALAKNMAFDQVANQFSEDPDNVSADGQTKMGGLVARWIGEDAAFELGQEYVTAAMNLKPGATSDILRVKSGKYAGVVILKGEESRQKSIPAMEEIKPQLIADFKAAALDKKFEDKRMELQEKIKNYSTLDEIAANTQMKTGLSTWTLTTSPIIAPELGVVDRDNLEYVQDLKPGERSDLIASTDNLYLLEVVKQRPSRIPPLAEIRQEVERAYRSETGRKMMRSDAEMLLKQSSSTETLHMAAAGMGKTVKTTDFFTRTQLPESLPSPLKDFARDSYPAQIGKPRMSLAGYGEADASACLVWAITAVQEPPRDGFLAQAPALQRELLVIKQQTLLEEWLRDRRNALVIDINPEFVGAE